MAHPPELKERAKELRKQGLLIRVISADLGVPKPTVIRWLNPELEKRERKNARKKKFSQKKRCAECGRRCNDNATLCLKCYLPSQRYWTREKLIEAVQEFALEHGRPPTHHDWYHSGEGHPAVSSICDGPNPPFAKWSDLIRAAGFTPGVRYRHPKRKPWSAQRKQERAEFRMRIREERLKKALAKGEQEGG